MTENQKKALTNLLIAVALFISVAMVNYVGKPHVLQPDMVNYQQVEFGINVVMIFDFVIGFAFLIVAIIYYKRES